MVRRGDADVMVAGCANPTRRDEGRLNDRAGARNYRHLQLLPDDCAGFSGRGRTLRFRRLRRQCRSFREESADIAIALAQRRRSLASHRVWPCCHSPPKAARSACVEKVREALNLVRRREAAPVDGEFRALRRCRACADKSEEQSAVAGQANVLIFRSRSGNIAYRLTQWVGGRRSGLSCRASPDRSAICRAAPAWTILSPLAQWWRLVSASTPAGRPAPTCA